MTLEIFILNKKTKNKCSIITLIFYDQPPRHMVFTEIRLHTWHVLVCNHFAKFNFEYL